MSAAGLPGALPAPGAGGSPHLPRFLSSGFETQRPPPPPTLALLSQAARSHWEAASPAPCLCVPFPFPLSSLQGNKGAFYKANWRRWGWEGGRESIKTRRGGVRDEAERPPGAPSGRGGQEAPAGARPTPWSVITRVGARARGRLGCPVEMLLAGSPKPGNRIAPAAGPGMGGAIPAGSPLGDPGPLLFPANSFEITQAWGEFTSLFQRGSLWYTRLARPHKVPELALVGYLQMARSPWARRPGGVPSAAE